MLRFILLFLCLTASYAARAQEKFTLGFIGTDRPDLIRASDQRSVRDSLEAVQEIVLFIRRLYGKGFLAASADSMVIREHKISVYVHAGQSYEWVELRKGNAGEAMLNKAGFRTKAFAGKTFRPAELQKLFNKLLELAENNGYPFAAVRLDSIQLFGNGIKSALSLQLNNAFYIDSLHIPGKKVVAPVYLHSYLGIRPGSLYNEQKVQQISSRLRELPFLSEQRPAELYFAGDKALVNLYLVRKNANQFDGLLGLLPRTGKPGQVRLGGQAHLRLLNGLRRGELLDISLQSLTEQTQELKSHFNYPFVFSTPFGIDLSLSIYKQDTTFAEVMQEAGIQYLFSGLNDLRLFVRNKNSSLLSDALLKNAQKIPEYADVSSTMYGIGFRAGQLDYRFNPRKGWLFSAEAGAGNREIRKNPVNEALYDSLNLKSTQYKAEMEAGLFIPLLRKQVVYLELSSGWLTGNQLFVNELYRLGGIHKLRGFDEGSIRASEYLAGTIEYRYLLEQNSYFFAFFDPAAYRSRSNSGNVEDTPYGFGTGISFETKAGIFSLSYALGKQFKNPVNLQTGKIHFGILSYF